jgi:hypothetical protein
VRGGEGEEGGYHNSEVAVVDTIVVDGWLEEVGVLLQPVD